MNTINNENEDENENKKTHKNNLQFTDLQFIYDFVDLFISQVLFWLAPPAVYAEPVEVPEALPKNRLHRPFDYAQGKLFEEMLPVK